MTPPTGPDHDRWTDASGAYLLGAMDVGEATAYEAHLEDCPACRAEVTELRPAVDALPVSVPQLQAPAAIGERVMADVRREAELLAAAGEGADRPAPARAATERRGRAAWWRWPAPALAAAALVVGVVVGLGAANVIKGQDAHTIALTATGLARGAHVNLVMDDGRATLEADHLPDPGSGRVYQVWLQPSGGKPEPTKSLFVPRRDGDASVAVPPEVGNMAAVLVTAEPDGGSPAPTSAPVLSADMS